MENIKRAKILAQEAAVYITESCEAIRIDNYDEDSFSGTGEETGESYTIAYSEVDLKNDMFYKLVLMQNG